MAKRKKTICIISSFYNERENLKKFIVSFDKTKDILSKGKKEVSTSQMGDAIISKLK